MAVEPVTLPLRLRPNARVTVLDSTSFADGDRLYVLTDAVPIDPKRFRRDADGTVAICGQQARVAFKRLIAGKSLTCEEDIRFASISFLTCSAGGKDLAETLVANGAATAATPRLAEVQQDALRRKAGVWVDAECRAPRDAAAAAATLKPGYATLPVPHRPVPAMTGQRPFLPSPSFASASRLPPTGSRHQAAIGDVHGCHDALLALEERIRKDAASHMAERPLLLYLGDYVDRGPASRAVIEHLAKPDHGDGIERIALCGNHDDTFLKFVFNPHQHLRWLDYGGDRHAALIRAGPCRLSRSRQGDARTRRSPPPGGFPSAISISCRTCRSRFRGDRLFVHAGIVPGVPLAQQEDHDLIWIREPFLSEGPDLPLTVIHGHTAGREPVFGKGRICIDTTCYATGRLTALRVTLAGAELV